MTSPSVTKNCAIVMGQCSLMRTVRFRHSAVHGSPSLESIQTPFDSECVNPTNLTLTAKTVLYIISVNTFLSRGCQKLHFKLGACSGYAPRPVPGPYSCKETNSRPETHRALTRLNRCCMKNVEPRIPHIDSRI